ncbi:membrane protein insertase YidC [Buchnera aphidicola]|uniref:membrane protein insertase YidC n=1 Tax=Buchnera aphidicola TaxID=9 RepID=UPI003463EB3A
MTYRRNFFIFSFLMISFFLWNLWAKNCSENIKNYFHKNSIEKIFKDKKHSQKKFQKIDLVFKKFFFSEKNFSNLIIKNSIQSNKLLHLYKNKIQGLQNFRCLKIFLKYGHNLHNFLFKKHINSEKSFFFLKNFIKEKKYLFQKRNKNFIFLQCGILKYFKENKKDCLLTKQKHDVFFTSYVERLEKKNSLKNVFSGFFSFFLKKILYKNFNILNLIKKIKFFLHDSGTQSLNIINKIQLLKKNIFYISIQNFEATIFSSFTKKITEKKIFFLPHFSLNFFVQKYCNLQFLCKESSTSSFIFFKSWNNIPREIHAFNKDLDPTTNSGFWWFLSEPFFEILKFINRIVGNWGFSIILMTILIRLCMYPITKSQYLSIVRLKNLQPKIDHLKEKYTNDQIKMSKKILEVYKKNDVYPFSGLLSLVMQMPIFLAFYYTLTDAKELKNAPFIFWINDLSSYDPFFILPIIMGITMIMMQKISSQKTFKEICSGNLHEKFMFFLPGIFAAFFLWFPSGLVLYYIISNIFSMIQQKYVYDSYNLKN